MRLSPEISAAVFFSVIASSRCRPEDTPGIQWQHDTDFVRVYRTELPWKPIDYQDHQRTQSSFAFVAWVAVLSVAVSAACLVLLSCVCWRLCGSHGGQQSRRQSSRADLVETGTHAAPDFRPSGNIYGTGLVNFAFTGSLQDPIPIQYTEDKPPEYSSVVGEVFPNDKEVQALNSDMNPPMIETPPPAYVLATEAPFPDPPN